MRKESITGLSELTGIDRRTIKTKISHLEFEQSGKSHMYNSVEALPIIYSKDGSVYDIEQERARLTHHQANIAELDELIKKKILIPEDVVKSRWEGIFANVRAKLLSIPQSLATSCVNAEHDQVEKEASNLIRQALNELIENVEY